MLDYGRIVMDYKRERERERGYWAREEGFFFIIRAF